MIYGKIWLHVKPSVGLPLFLGAVAVTSLVVHVGLTVNTTWVKRFHEGGTGVAKKAAIDTTTIVAAALPRATTD
jgi:light-harvesting protein B-800-850 alpha chain